MPLVRIFSKVVLFGLLAGVDDAAATTEEVTEDEAED